MKKIYVLDTNVLLHDPNAIFSFQDNEVVIPFDVIEELDVIMHREVRLVESADVAEQAATNQAGGSARAEHFALLARFPDRSPVHTFEGSS